MVKVRFLHVRVQSLLNVPSTLWESYEVGKNLLSISFRGSCSAEVMYRHQPMQKWVLQILCIWVFQNGLMPAGPINSLTDS